MWTELTHISTHAHRIWFVLRQSAVHLTNLDLQGNKLGDMTGAALADYLLIATCLKRLDLSWNEFAGSGACAIASAMGTNQGLRFLNLAHNRFGDAATQSLGLELCDHQSLQELDLSHNRVPAAAAIVMSNALKRCPTLHTLLLNDNPIGNEGIAAVLRAIANRSEERDQLGAPKWLNAVQPVHVSLSNCRRGRASNRNSKDGHLFNPANPAGTFNLSMRVPYDCIVLDMITTEAAHRLGFLVDAFYYTPPKASGGSEAAGADGRVQLEFGTSLARSATAPVLGAHDARALQTRLEGMDEIDRERYKKEVTRSMEIRVAGSGKQWKRPRTGRVFVKIRYHKYPSKWWHAIKNYTFAALMAVVNRSTQDHEDRLTMLNLLSEDMDMNCEQVQQLLDSGIMQESTEKLRIKQMARFLCRVVDNDHVHELIHNNLSGGGRKRLKKELGAMYRLVVKNPTGHFKLLLDKPSDRAVFYRLGEINEEEAAKRKRSCDNGMGPGDTSQHGGWGNMRNVTIDGARFSPDSRVRRSCEPVPLVFSTLSFRLFHSCH